MADFESSIEALTTREQDVLICIAKGYSYTEIGAVLYIRDTTIKYHVQNIYDKLGLEAGQRNHRELVAHARSQGVLEAIAALTASEVPDVPNPYKGLRPFQQTDAEEFYGRETLIRQLLACLSETGENSRFLAVIGPSGCGKSSAVHAGLLPALQQGKVPGSDTWTVTCMTPGAYPLDELEVALTRIGLQSGIDIRAQLQRDERGLQRVAGMLLPENGELLLVVDQFEEVFSLVQDEANRRAFLALLAEAVTCVRSRVRVIITLRADFYDRPLMYTAFGELVREHTEVIMPLTPDELERAIRKPAQKIGVNIEPGLVAAVVAEVSENPGALPLMQYSLTETFDCRTELGMTLAAYNQIGGVRGALTRRADALYEGLSEPQQNSLQQVFLRLITLGEGTEDLRRRVSLSELTSIGVDSTIVEQLIDDFAQHRLLTLDHDPANGNAVVTVAHEALIREWPLLRTWLDASRDEIRLQRLLAAGASEWRDSGRDNSYLLHGSRLAQFKEWTHDSTVILTDQESEFLKASLDDEQRQWARRRRLRNLVFAAAGVVVLVFAILALVANSERANAEAARYEARQQASIGLAAIALGELENGEQDRAVLLALEALENYPYTSQAESALADAVEAYLPKTNPTAVETAWSPDRERFAIVRQTAITRGQEGGSTFELVIMETGSNAERHSFPVDPGCSPENVRWSLDGSRLLSVFVAGGYATEPCLAPPTVWNTDTGAQLYRLAGHEGPVLTAEWSPDSTEIMTAGADGTARVWDTLTGMEKLSITGHTSSVNDAVWSTDGREIATASADMTVRIWDAASGEELRTIGKHNDIVTSVSWSPDGTRIATASEDGTAYIWDAATGEALVNLVGHQDAVMDILFSPNGSRIATKEGQFTVRIWDARTGAQLATFPLATGLWSRYLVWSPDGTRFADRELANLPLVLAGHANSVYDAEWSPDGSHIATFSKDSTARIWDAGTGEELLVLDHPNEVFYSNWSPDGTRVVTTCIDGMIRIWDAATGEIALEWRAALQNDFLFEASWSPDGARIVTIDLTSKATVWDAATGEALATLDDEAARALLGPNEVYCVLFGPSWSPDSSQIATGCGNWYEGTGPLVWDASTGELVRALDVAGETRESTFRVEWAPDGTKLVGGHPVEIRDGEARNIGRVWDLDTGEVLHTFPGADFAVSWSPSGARIAANSGRQAVIWDAVTGARVRSFDVPNEILNIRWSPDERHVIAVGHFNTPVIRHVWPSTQALINEAYECCVTRQLSPEERAQFGLPPTEE